MTIHLQARNVRPVTSDHDAPRGKGPLLNLDTMSTRDRARAVLDAGEYRGHWQIIGRSDDGRYVLQMASGKTEAMTERQILDWPVQRFINTNDKDA